MAVWSCCRSKPLPNILVTGANRGLGLELVRQYSGAGERIIATCRSPHKADVLNSVAKTSVGRVTVHPLDVSSAESIEACARELADMSIDILINNAGVSSARQTLQDMDFESWGQLFNTMVVGPFRVSRAFIPNLRAGRNPRIVTLSSMLGSSRFSLGGYYAYSSCKAAVGRVMCTLATDLKEQNITVATVDPGWVKTDLCGPEADLTADRSIAGVRHVIAKLAPADSGSLLNWDGSPHPW